MKKGFTLVEMLIVVVVLVTLMTMTFKLSSINGTNSKRNATVAKLQKLENALSGYFAAFGTYPPVKLHGSRNPFLPVGMHGMQDLDAAEDRNVFNWDIDKFRRGESDAEEQRAWRQVKAACKAQPVDCKFPFPKGYDQLVSAHSDMMKVEAQNSSGMDTDRKQVLMAGFDGAGRNIGRFSAYQDKTEWRDLQLFKFGLLSYLLPRYLMMMNADESLYEDFEQWKANNTLPCDPIEGRKFSDWKKVCEKANSTTRNELMHVENIPSQAVCARWLPNLAGAIYTPHTLKLFGVDLREDEDGGFSTTSTEIFSPGSYKQDSSAQQYMLDFCTMRDGWWYDIYYYSPPPYQTYVVWSGGANERTFPPWISRDTLSKQENEHIGAWTEDDIVSMSH